MELTDEHFNPETYMVIDRITGEEVQVHIFIEKVKENGWEKAWAKTLAEYMNINGTGVQKVLSYFLAERDNNNIVVGTNRGIAKKIGVSSRTVNRTMVAMQEKGFLKKVQNGLWFVSPRMIRNGYNGKGVMLLRLWDESDN